MFLLGGADLKHAQQAAAEYRILLGCTGSSTLRSSRTARGLHAALRRPIFATVRAPALRKEGRKSRIGTIFEPIGSIRDPQQQDTGWLLTVVGKGSKLREVPVPVSLVDELQEDLERNGLAADVMAESNQDVSVLMRFEEGTAQPWSMSWLAKGIKALLAQIATDIDPEDAKQLRRASTHWLRHTHGSHALNGRPGETGVPIQVVQNNLGHASIGTTSGYLTTERDLRLAAMRGFGAKRS